MANSQREQNPDVNSDSPGDDPGESPAGGNHDSNDVERIPVPPDATPVPPVEEPPGSGGPAVGDVDDKPIRIADDRA